MLTLFSNFGIMAGPSTVKPITSKDVNSVNMSFVAYADPQILPFGYHSYYLDCGFEDIENSGMNFDALVIAGILTENGDLGEDSEEAREILVKNENVFLLSGHLHDGISEKSLEVLNEENGVYSINLPAYGRPNEVGEFRQMGLGAYVEVYDKEVVFTSRDFAAGAELEGYSMSFDLV